MANSPCVDAVQTVPAHYCSLINTACTGFDQQYNSMADCMGSFVAFPNASVTVSTNNTQGARQYHIQARIVLDDDTHCQHAGPSGGGVVGNVYQSWKYLANQAACTPYATVRNSVAGFDAWNMTDIMAAVPSGTAGSYYVGASGNTALCRIYHLTVATNAAAAHCSHGDLLASNVAGMTVSSVCGDFEDNACGVIQAACGTTAFATMGACSTAIEALIPTKMGLPGDTFGDTFACRMLNAQLALGAKASMMATDSFCMKVANGCPAAPKKSSASALSVAAASFLGLFLL
jgi:hypothetical protein